MAHPPLYVLTARFPDGSRHAFERYAPTPQAARAAIHPALHRVGARLLCTRMHTGERYGLRGRFC